MAGANLASLLALEQPAGGIWGYSPPEITEACIRCYWHTSRCNREEGNKKATSVTSLAIQQLRFWASTAGDAGLILRQGTKILHSSQCGQKKKKECSKLSQSRHFLENLDNVGASLVTDGKKFVCSAGDVGLIPGLGTSPGEGNGYPFQYSCLENPMDKGDWRATVHKVAESDMTNTSISLSLQYGIARERVLLPWV